MKKFTCTSPPPPACTHTGTVSGRIHKNQYKFSGEELVGWGWEETTSHSVPMYLENFVL